jgi:hypothetical protein
MPAKIYLAEEEGAEFFQYTKGSFPMSVLVEIKCSITCHPNHVVIKDNLVDRVLGQQLQPQTNGTMSGTWGPWDEVNGLRAFVNLGNATPSTQVTVDVVAKSSTGTAQRSVTFFTDAKGNGFTGSIDLGLL